MHRFFVEPNQIENSIVHFSPEISRQITRVLRLEPGTEVMVLDNSGKEYLSRITEPDPISGTAEIISGHQSLGEPSTDLTMMLCLTQREKFEWVLQKCTEIGVSRFIPVLSSRSLVQQEQAVLEKMPRWGKILKEAAEQSGRGRIPLLASPLRFGEAVKGLTFPGTLRLVLWEEERTMNLKNLLKSNASRNIILLIGPEGGFSREEINQAVEEGFRSVSLGPRILRMETAAIAAAAIVVYQLEPDS